MKRIGFIWIESEEEFHSEAGNCLWNAVEAVVSKLVVLCGDKETEASCTAKGIESIYYPKGNGRADKVGNAESAENAWRRNQVIFERFSVDKYDEIVFVDGGMMGPFYPLEEMFAKMSEKTECANEAEASGKAVSSSEQADFWGLVRLAAMYTPKKEKFPEHIDSHFLVLRKSVFKFINSLEFYENNLPFHIAVPYVLEQAGYRGAAYCDTKKYQNVRNCNNFNWFEGKAYELVKKECCPFVPAEIFSNKNFFSDDGHDARRLLEYVIETLHFPQDYLWGKLLRRFAAGDIYQGLHLDYVLDEYHTDFGRNASEGNKRAAVIIHVYYADLLYKVAQFAMNVPEWMDIYITTSVEENIGAIDEIFSFRQIANYKVIKVQNRGRDCSALLVGCQEIIRDYEYLCFVHDKKTSGNNGTCPIGERFMDSLFENLLGSEEYIYNIMELFEKNPHLGLAAPPIPVHGQYFCLKDDAWTCCFDETAKLAWMLGLPIKLDKEKPPFVLSTSFWCRVKALEPLFTYGFSYEDFCGEPMPEDGTISHAIERILPYIVQAQGYYSAIVMTTANASLHISNLNYQLMGTVQRLRDNYSISSYSNFENFDFDEFMEFCHKYKSIYIYGTGLYGRKYAEILDYRKIPYIGFIVTKKNVAGKVSGHPVYGYGEFLDMEEKCLDEVGIVVAVSVYYQEEISEMLEQNDICNYYIV